MKGKTPKAILQRRRQSQPKKPKPIPAKPQWDWKYLTGTVIAIVGLILGAIGLQARPTVSLDSPLDSTNPLTTPVVISNDGVLGLKNVNVISFIVEAKYVDGGEQQGNIGKGYAPPNQTLETGDRETVPIDSFLVEVTFPVSYADVALIITFTPEFMPFVHKRRVFRFRTVQQANGEVIFQQQPPEDAFEQYQRVLQFLHRPTLH